MYNRTMYSACGGRFQRQNVNSGLSQCVYDTFKHSRRRTIGANAAEARETGDPQTVSAAMAKFRAENQDALLERSPVPEADQDRILRASCHPSPMSRAALRALTFVRQSATSLRAASGDWLSESFSATSAYELCYNDNHRDMTLCSVSQIEKGMK
jgi:hypothetical protein